MEPRELLANHLTRLINTGELEKSAKTVKLWYTFCI